MPQDTRIKLQILADAAKYDASCASSGAKRTNTKTGLGNSDGTGICHSYTPDGRCVSLLKILLTNHCIYDCKYCVNRVSNETPRARFTVDEVVDLTIGFYKRNFIEGLFLSSGVISSPDYTMDLLIQVAKKLRLDHEYHGYIHLKAVVGASPEMLAEAGKWADRLSANIELPTQPDLDELAPEKTIDGAERSMSAIKYSIDEDRDRRGLVGGRASAIDQKDLTPSPLPPRRRLIAPAGQSTQMIVGATPTPDTTILQTATDLYNRHRLKRVYYTAYSPIPNADYHLPVKPPMLLREHRLYQADWLLRFYGFKADELAVDASHNLPLETDPKTSWALAHRDFFPVDVNTASRSVLLRVPGFGTRSVGRILKTRRHRKLSMEDLKKLGCVMKRARFFVTASTTNIHVRRLDSLGLHDLLTRHNPQLSLFEAGASAATGAV